jgi:hypothetical protein
MHSLGPSELAVVILETGLLTAWGTVAALMARSRVNGPCRLCMGMLLVWRAAVLLNLQCEGPCWQYLWGVVFAYCFLYAIHHIAHVVTASGARQSCGTGAVESPDGRNEPAHLAPCTKPVRSEPPQFTLAALLTAADGSRGGTTPRRRAVCQTEAR